MRDNEKSQRQWQNDNILVISTPCQSLSLQREIPRLMKKFIRAEDDQELVYCTHLEDILDAFIKERYSEVIITKSIRSYSQGDLVDDMQPGLEAFITEICRDNGYEPTIMEVNFA